VPAHPQITPQSLRERLKLWPTKLQNVEQQQLGYLDAPGALASLRFLGTTIPQGTFLQGSCLRPDGCLITNKQFADLGVVPIIGLAVVPIIGLGVKPIIDLGVVPIIDLGVVPIIDLGVLPVIALYTRAVPRADDGAASKHC
jgi:hypothetical protein